MNSHLGDLIVIRVRLIYIRLYVSIMSNSMAGHLMIRESTYVSTFTLSSQYWTD